MIAGGVLNSGLLATPVAGATFDYTAAPAELVARAQRLQAVCDGFGVPLPAATLQFVLPRHPSVTHTLVGARSAAEIEADVAYADLAIDPSLSGALDAALA